MSDSSIDLILQFSSTLTLLFEEETLHFVIYESQLGLIESYPDVKN